MRSSTSSEKAFYFVMSSLWIHNEGISLICKEKQTSKIKKNKVESCVRKKRDYKLFIWTSLSFFLCAGSFVLSHLSYSCPIVSSAYLIFNIEFEVQHTKVEKLITNSVLNFVLKLKKLLFLICHCTRVQMSTVLMFYEVIDFLCVQVFDCASFLWEKNFC